MMQKIWLFFLTAAALVAANISTEDFMKRIEAGDIFYKQYFHKSAKDAFKDISNSSKKEPTLFIFSSLSVPLLTINNYLRDAKKLGLKTYLVYRGLNDKLKYKMHLMAKDRDNFLAKIHPFMFYDLNVTRVPVIVFAKCPANEFRYKKCNYLYKMTGDASLSYFFKMAAEKGKDKEMEKYWQKLDEVK